MKKILKNIAMLSFVALLMLSACVDDLAPEPVTLDVEQQITEDEVIDKRSDDGQHEDSVRWG